MLGRSAAVSPSPRLRPNFFYKLAVIARFMRAIHFFRVAKLDCPDEPGNDGSRISSKA